MGRRRTMPGKAKALLVLGAAFAVALAGTVYAHWRETLTVDAAVTTRALDWPYTPALTDGDGRLAGCFD